MASNRRNRRDANEAAKISRDLLRKIGLLEPYAEAIPSQVEERLRNMNYGATNSRVSKLRRGEADTSVTIE